MIHFKHDWATRSIRTEVLWYEDYETDNAYGYPYSVSEPYEMEELWVRLECLKCSKEKVIFKKKPFNSFTKELES